MWFKQIHQHPITLSTSSSPHVHGSVAQYPTQTTNRRRLCEIYFSSQALMFLNRGICVSPIRFINLAYTLAFFQTQHTARVSWYGRMQDGQKSLFCGLPWWKAILWDGGRKYVDVRKRGLDTGTVEAVDGGSEYCSSKVGASIQVSYTFATREWSRVQPVTA